jgi:hypothetical protein
VFFSSFFSFWEDFNKNWLVHSICSDSDKDIVRTSCFRLNNWNERQSCLWRYVRYKLLSRDHAIPDTQIDRYTDTQRDCLRQFWGTRLFLFWWRIRWRHHVPPTEHFLPDVLPDYFCSDDEYDDDIMFPHRTFLHSVPPPSRLSLCARYHCPALVYHSAVLLGACTVSLHA